MLKQTRILLRGWFVNECMQWAIVVKCEAFFLSIQKAQGSKSRPGLSSSCLFSVFFHSPQLVWYTFCPIYYCPGHSPGTDPWIVQPIAWSLYWLSYPDSVMNLQDQESV
jgi:hypothetical protein